MKIPCCQIAERREEKETRAFEKAIRKRKRKKAPVCAPTSRDIVSNNVGRKREEGAYEQRASKRRTGTRTTDLFGLIFFILSIEGGGGGGKKEQHFIEQH